MQLYNKKKKNSELRLKSVSEHKFYFNCLIFFLQQAMLTHIIKIDIEMCGTNELSKYQEKIKDLFRSKIENVSRKCLINWTN